MDGNSEKNTMRGTIPSPSCEEIMAKALLKYDLVPIIDSPDCRISLFVPTSPVPEDAVPEEKSTGKDLEGWD